MSDARADAIAAEQRHVDRAYARLEELRERAEERRRAALGTRVVTPADLVDRDAAAYQAARRVRALSLGDTEPLVFGRIFRSDGEDHHVGRVSVLSQEYDALVVDWRSDVAAPFYRATPAEPHGLRHRRVIQCRGPRVLSVEDQILALDPQGAEVETLVGDAALMAAVTRDRSEQMHDIVATIQREQDEAIRLPARGLVIVTGGPGTGKTAVALHRVAYLLYQHRERLERRGVLVVGPSRGFVDYIQGVLPALGETRTVMLPLGAFVPGVSTERHDDPPLAAIKGDPRMTTVLGRLADRLEDEARRARSHRREGPARPAFERLRAGTLRLDEVARGVLSDEEVARLAEAWRADQQADLPPTVEDVALIDELRWALGVSDQPAGRTPPPPSDELTTFADRSVAIDPGELISDPDYTGFGHVVVDEAQDLTVMQWRMVARRGREASWTVVGDLAQRASPAAPDGWQAVADLLGVHEATVTGLSVNYRTSRVIMELASRLLPVVAPGQDPPRSVRRDGQPPRIVTDAHDVVTATVREARTARDAVTGTAAVVAPSHLVDEIRERLDRLEVRVLDPWAAKGLEYDAVVVAQPQEIAEVPGAGALYVALTRATERLTVVTSRPRLPAPLGSG